MIAETIQVNSDVALNLITGGLAIVTAVMAGATVWLGFETRAAVKVAEESVLVARHEADATLELARGAREDRELVVRPVLLSLRTWEQDLPQQKDVPIIVVRNIGRGPAIRTRVIRWYRGRWCHTPGWGQAVEAAATYPPQPEPEPTPMGDVSKRYGWALESVRDSDAMPGFPSSPGPTDDSWACCLDQLGNALRFNLRTGDPPEISRHDAAPEGWAWVITDLG